MAATETARAPLRGTLLRIVESALCLVDALDGTAEEGRHDGNGPGSAAAAYTGLQAVVASFAAVPDATDEQTRAFQDSVLPLKALVARAPCDSRPAALAKLAHVHAELNQDHAFGHEIVAQVLGWLKEQP